MSIRKHLNPPQLTQIEDCQEASLNIERLLQSNWQEILRQLSLPLTVVKLELATIRQDHY